MAPNRLPSLFTSADGESQEQPEVSLVVDEPVLAVAPEQFDWAGTAATATLSAGLLDLVVDSSGEVSIFADLIMGMSEEATAELLEEWHHIPKPSCPEPLDNLFRAFGIELPAAVGCDYGSLEPIRRKKPAPRRVVSMPSLFVAPGDHDE